MSSELGKRIRRAREDQGWTQKQLGEALGYSSVGVQHWEHGRSAPGYDILKELARVLGKPMGYFIPGATSDKESVRREIEQEVRRDIAAFVGVKVLPVIGRIAAGIPILAEENVEEWLPVPKEFGDQADFLLRVTGNSMVDAGIYEGDYVLVRRVDEAKSGDIVVALVNGDGATLKFLRCRDNHYYLEAANPEYTPIQVDQEVHIQGVYIGLFTRRGLAATGAQSPPPSTLTLIESLAKQEDVDPSELMGAIAALKSLRGRRLEK